MVIGADDWDTLPATTCAAQLPEIPLDDNLTIDESILQSDAEDVNIAVDGGDQQPVHQSSSHWP